MEHIDGLVSLSRLISFQSKLKDLDSNIIAQYFDTAWRYVSNKINLKPTVISLLFDLPGVVSIVNEPLAVNDGLLYIKEVIDVSGTKLNAVPNMKVFTTPTILLDGIIKPVGSYYWDGPLLYGDGVINILCYPYPLYSTEKISPAIGFALISMMQSYNAKDRQDFSSAGIYENIAISYINLYNNNVIQPKVSTMTEAVRITPYGL